VIVCATDVCSLFANQIVAHLCVPAIDYSCTAAPVFDCGHERVGLELEFIFGNAVPVFCEISTILSHFGLSFLQFDLLGSVILCRNLSFAGMESKM